MHLNLNLMNSLWPNSIYLWTTYGFRASTVPSENEARTCFPEEKVQGHLAGLQQNDLFVGQNENESFTLGFLYVFMFINVLTNMVHY